jgi:hypothetical protein
MGRQIAPWAANAHPEKGAHVSGTRAGGFMPGQSGAEGDHSGAVLTASPDSPPDSDVYAGGRNGCSP